jgi:DNA-binding transcriptional LysR family regulator
MLAAKRAERLNLDVAALQTLRVVYDTASFTRAAELLEVNQSTISYTMDRLRHMFDDPLFLRSGRGIVATTRCAELAERAREILSQLDAIRHPQSFDPAAERFKVIFALDHTERVILMTHIVRYLRRHAPEVRLQLIDGHRHGHARLRDGLCDLLLTPDDHDSPTLYRRRLYRDSYICVVDRDSPFVSRGMTLAEYSAARHIVVSCEGMRRPAYLALLERQGLPHETVIDLTSTSEIQRLVRGTDLVATVSARLAATYGDEVAVIAAPFELQTDTYMYWTSRTHRAERMRWIRDLVARAAQGGLSS